MEYPNSPQALLDRLDHLLAEVPASLSCTEDLNDPDYTLQHEQWQKVTSQVQMNIDYIVEKACHLLKTSPGPPFRICSIGCGDGKFDKKVLTSILEQFPDTELQYMGVDINELSCRRARELLVPLSNVEADIYHRNIQDVSVADIQPFHLVIAVHVLYYMTSLEAILTKVLRMVKPNGLAVIVLASKSRTPFLKLKNRFRIHEHKSQFWFSLDAVQALENVGASYNMDTVHAVIDLTSCFMEDFQQLKHKQILECITGIKMSHYPSIIAKTCKEYLSSIANGKPDRFLITHDADIILIEGES